MALNILDGTISASVGKNTSITTHGEDSIEIEETEETEDEAGNEGQKANFVLTADEIGNAVTRASGFAMGQSTAVGAAVAINIISTGVNVGFEGAAALEQGTAHIAGSSSSEDESNAIATAMGADMQRYIDKLHDTTAKAEDILSGQYWNKSDSGSSDDKKENKTADSINSKLDKNSDKEDGEKANSGAALSTNVLRTQNVGDKTRTDGANDDISKAGTEANNASDQDLGVNGGSEGSSVQVAAAVGLTISKHKVNTKVSGKIDAANGIDILAGNEGNFRTLGTGIAMSLSDSATSIAAGVAVSVNRNEANVLVGDSTELASEDGDVNVQADLTQNTTGKYNGLLAAQAIAGSVAGSGGTSIGGAISVLVSSAETKAQIGNEASISAHKIAVEATDKSKMAIRAGGISISKGGSVGVGASVAVIVSNNVVDASIGTGAHITGNHLAVLAAKRMVTISDYQLPYGITDAVSNSTGAGSDAETGVLDMKKEGSSYQVSINITSEDLLKAVDLLNFLASTNYYAEAIGAAVSAGAGGGSSVMVGGSIAVMTFKNMINAAIGNNAVIDITRNTKQGAPADEDGSITVDAYSGSNTRIIAGAVSITTGGTGVGADVAVLVNNDAVSSSVGSAGTATLNGKQIKGVQAEGNFRQTADVDAYTQIFSVAAAGASKNAIGGGIDVIVSNSKAIATVAEGARIEAAGGVDVSSKTDADFLLVSASAAVSTSGSVAVGGRVNVNVNKAITQTIIGKNAILTAGDRKSVV